MPIVRLYFSTSCNAAMRPGTWDMSSVLSACCDWKGPMFFAWKPRLSSETHTAPTTTVSALLAAISAAILGVQLAIQAIVHVRHAQGQEPQIASRINATWDLSRKATILQGLQGLEVLQGSTTSTISATNTTSSLANKPTLKRVKVCFGISSAAWDCATSAPLGC